MRISECREEDVVLLDRHMPFLSCGAQHRSRFDRHRAGTTTLLVAWRDRLPVGSCEVRWDGCEAPEVRSAHPACPEANGIGLWPETLRSEGLAGALLHAAEQYAAERGRTQLGLGVEKNTPRAEALYKRLGYLPSVPYLDCWSYDDGEGQTHRVADACVFMVKSLS